MAKNDDVKNDYNYSNHSSIQRKKITNREQEKHSIHHHKTYNKTEKKLSEDKRSCKLRRNVILYISRKEGQTKIEETEGRKMQIHTHNQYELKY